jgi:hypothetical protein
MLEKQNRKRLIQARKIVCINGDRMQAKKCAKCNEVKPLNDFEVNQYSPDGRYLICKVCFDKRLKATTHIPEAKVENQKPVKAKAAASGAVRAKKPTVPQQSDWTVEPIISKPELKNDEKQINEIRQAQQEILSDRKEASLQAQGLLPKLRKCSGCKKVEPVGKAPLVPPKPVQAWFCKDCISKKTHTYAGKGYLVYDFWGRVYKVSKIVDNEVVRGVVKKGDGSWSTRKFNIHGRWLTKKPI